MAREFAWFARESWDFMGASESFGSFCSYMTGLIPAYRNFRKQQKD